MKFSYSEHRGFDVLTVEGLPLEVLFQSGEPKHIYAYGIEFEVDTVEARNLLVNRPGHYSLYDYALMASLAYPDIMKEINAERNSEARHNDTLRSKSS